MKNIYISLLFLCSFSLNAQKVDYDNASKWYWGLNLGGTWQTTDVASKTGTGWGITLGKSYNYNYGKPISFDIQGRYLNGNWYGQDKDSTPISGLSQDNALYGYQNGLGYTYHNYKSNVHRLALELAIHLNALTQRTGWDPYIFGGIGLTWNKTYANLTDSADFMFLEPTLYPYQNGISTINFDNSYETSLDGYSKYKVNFMPSLGFGLGYHIRKRTTLGIEHKTTFTLKDNFDAVESTTPRSKKDLYHYTSVYLKFRLRGSGNGGASSNTTGGATVCPNPVITVETPLNLTVTNPQFEITFRATEVVSQNGIQVLNGNNAPLFFNFNTSTKQGKASVTLVPGVNTFTITARNRCGTDSKTFTVTYNKCSLPTVSFTNPITTGSIVKSPAFVLGAIVNGIQNKSLIKLYANGILLNNFSFNNQNGVIQANVNLIVGKNNFRIELSNACGNATIESNIIFDNCIAPTALFLNPSASGTTVNSQNLVIKANVTGINSNQQVNIDVNGIATRNFTLVNGVITANIVLTPGLNTITVRLNNACGSDTEVTTINYQTCNAPIITVVSPTQNSKVTNPALRLRTTIDNIQGKNNLKIKLNGVDVSNFNFNVGSKLADASITLINGLNSITVSATNNCGTDVETIIVEYDNCIAPGVNIISSGNETTNNSYTLTAAITNMADANGIAVSRNGQDIGFNFSNGQLFSAVSLLPGVNTFIINATKSCGTATKTISVNYRDCEVPTLNIIQPSSAITVNTTTYSFSANSTNVSSLNQVIVTLNNQVVNTSMAAGVISGSLNLSEGLNTLFVKVTNACGTDVKTITINRVSCTPPNVSISGPTQNSSVNRAGLAFEGTLQNTNSYNLTVNGNAVSALRNGNTVRGNLTLKPGNNIIVLNGMNDCGNDSETVNVFYDNCVAPVITINSTSANQTVNSSAYTILASVTNSSQNAVAFTLNGIQKPFSFSGNTLSSNLVLNEGTNVILIATSNTCGTDAKTITVNYVVPTEEKIIICHYPPGNTGNPQQLEIPSSAWPAHQARGDVLGPCPSNNNGNSGGSSGNSGGADNNGHGNNEDGVDVSNPGQGNGGPNGTTDQNGSVDDESTGSGAATGTESADSTGNGSINGSGSTENNDPVNGGSNGNSGGAGNNGHGNNEDGVDVSNPGQGNGGPNGTTDQSGSVDNESTGSGAATGTESTDSTGNDINNGSNSNGNSGNGNSNGNGGGNNSNNVQTDSTTGNGSNGNGGNTTGSNSDGSSNSSSNCLDPVITLPTFMRGGIVVSNTTFNLLGSVANYGATGQIAVLFNNNNVPVNISAEESFVTTVTLNLGMNSFVVNTSNSCGSDSKSLNVELISENPQNNQNNGGNGNNNNQNGGQKAQQSGGKPTTNKPNTKPQVTNNPGQNNTNKTNPTEKKEEKPKEEAPKENKPKGGTKVNTINKGGGK